MGLRRTEITIETRRKLVINRRQKRVVRDLCAPCGAERHMVTVEYAALLSGLSLRQLFRHVEGGRLHFLETPKGSFVCLDSLCALSPQTQELNIGTIRR